MSVQSDKARDTELPSKSEVYTPLSFSESKAPPCTYVEDAKGSNTYSKSKEIDPQDGTLIPPGGV